MHVKVDGLVVEEELGEQAQALTEELKERKSEQMGNRKAERERERERERIHPNLDCLRGLPIQFIDREMTVLINAASGRIGRLAEALKKQSSKQKPTKLP